MSQWLERLRAAKAAHVLTAPCQHDAQHSLDGQRVCAVCGEIVGEVPTGHRSQTTDDTATLTAQQDDVVRLMFETAPNNDASATEPSTEACTHQEQSQAQPVAVSPAVVWRCYVCHGNRRWKSIYDVLICGTCHPPADMTLVASWEDEEPYGPEHD